MRIGFLIDNEKLSVWQHEIVKWVLANPSFEFVLFVKNESQQSTGSKKSLVFRLFMKLDQLLFKVKNSAFQQSKTFTIDDEGECLSISKLEGKVFTRFTQEDILTIQSKQLDVLIRFGFGILKGEILTAAQYGVWSLHHGNNEVNRGGPPAFWEIVNKEPTTGVTLQVLTEDLDGGTVIGKSFSKTDFTSFHRNLNAALWAGVELFTNKLSELEENPSIISDSCNNLNFYHYPLYKDPKHLKSLIIFIGYWYSRIKNLLVDKLYPKKWSLAFKYNKDSNIETSLFRYRTIKSPKNEDWADPFVIHFQDKFLVFFEQLNKKSQKGVISYLEFSDKGKQLTPKPIKVIEENFHLSYPYIFEHDDKFFILPESGASQKLTLYQAVDFPKQWQAAKVLLEEEVYDPTLYHHQDVWYLFVTKRVLNDSSPDQYLHIYYADDLLSATWHPHPQNPIKRTVNGSRPAGKIFNWNDQLIRPAQIGSPRYGFGIQFFEITMLSKEYFEEQSISAIEPGWNDKLLACHTFNFSRGFNIIDIQHR